MDLSHLLIGLALLLSLSLALTLRQAWRLRNLFPYRVSGPLLSAAEMRLLEALEEALGSGYRIFGKVWAEDVIGVESGVGRRVQERAWARLAEHRFDFAICDSRTLRVLCAIDLIGDQRGRPTQRGPNAVLAKICDAAGLPLVTIRAADDYDPADLARELRGAMLAYRADHPESPTLDAAGPSRNEEDLLLAQLSAAILADDEPGRHPAAARRRDRATRSAR